MRCFVAIEIDEECRKALTAAVEKLRDCAGEARWVNPHNMHLTLKFIGNLDKNLLPDLCYGLSSVCEHIPPFTMRVEGLGAFPPRGRPKVIFAGVRGEKEHLMRLAEQVETELAERARIKKETRKFIPHITLCRARRRRECPDVEKLSGKLDNTYFGDVNVRDLVLMQSQLTPAGPEYTVMERFALQ